MRPHSWQPTRLPRPWDSPGKNTGVGCHCLLQCMKVKRESEVAQSCPTLIDPMDCSLPGSSVHGIFQARVLEWGAIAFSEIKGRHIYCSVLKDLGSLCLGFLSWNAPYSYVFVSSSPLWIPFWELGIKDPTQMVVLWLQLLLWTANHPLSLFTVRVFYKHPWNWQINL